MKKFILIFFICLFVHTSIVAQINKDEVFQTSPIISLLNGVMNGDFTINRLKEHGSFGLGTFNGIDGEMVMLNGNIYKVPADGNVIIASAEEKTPFAAVTFFDTDRTIHLSGNLSQNDLYNFIDKRLPSPNRIYAIKIEGRFKLIKARSEMKQEKPYSDLADVLKDQAIFDLTDVEGTLVGFKFPSFLTGVNTAGYHFHFISKDKKKGGHVLLLTPEDVEIEIDFKNGLEVEFPQGDEFNNAQLK